jgi:hypothetical protein
VDDDTTKQAVEYVKRLLDGESPNGTNPDEWGQHTDSIKALQSAHEDGGTDGVKRAWNAIAPQDQVLALAMRGAEDDDTEKDPFKAWLQQAESIDDLGERLPPIQYVVGSLIEEASLNIVFGAPGLYKSFLVADMAVCVAAGHRWLTPLPNQDGRSFQTYQSPVFWIDCDNGKRRTIERLTALKRAYQIPPGTPLHYLSMPSPWPDMGDEKMRSTIVGTALHFGAKLIVVDNLGTVCGGVDENSHEMVSVMSDFRRICEDTGAAIVLIHHQRKAQAVGGRAGDSLRGHSSIEAALDLALKIERELGAESLTVSATKVRGADVQPFAAIFGFDQFDDSQELDGARFYSFEAGDGETEQDIDRAILGTLSGGIDLNQSMILDELKKAQPGIGMKRVLGRIAKLVDRKKLAVKKRENNSKWYSLV